MPATLNTITSLTQASLKGKRVLVRADFNVPYGEDGIVDETEAWRIEKGLATLRYLREAQARVVVMSHLGDSTASLKPVAEYINKEFQIGFVPQIVGDVVQGIVEELPHGGVVLLENLRQHPGEKANEESFAAELSTYGDIYVNDAFSASHRSHASIVGVPEHLPAYAGIQCASEYEHLSQVRTPEQPALLVLAGAKFGTKLTLLEAYLPKVHRAVVAGALANNFYKAMGHSVGDSLVDDGSDIGHLVGNEKIVIPVDVTVTNATGQVFIRNPRGEILPGEIVADIGPKGTESIIALAKEAKTIIWNGPLGNYEAGFSAETAKLARALANVPADVYVGGGDTVTVLNQEGITEGFTFVSTAGGAMLDFLVDGELPGLRPLFR